MHITNKDIKPFAVLIPLIYFAIIMIWQYRLPGISTDGQTYLQIARNIHYGIGLGWQALWASPLHSILIALVAWLPGAHDLQFAAGIVSILMGALLTVSLYVLTTALFDWKAGVMATIVVLSFPHAINMHFTTEPEITYTAFLMASLILLLFTIIKDSFSLAITFRKSCRDGYPTQADFSTSLKFTQYILPCWHLLPHFLAGVNRQRRLFEITLNGSILGTEKLQVTSGEELYLPARYQRQAMNRQGVVKFTLKDG